MATPPAAGFRLGVDIGGTFTDATLVDEASGRVHICKLSSTPADPSDGFLRITSRILDQAGVSPAEVSYVVHGTTVATNSIIEGRLAPTGFVTTEGFRDLLEIQRQIRASLYDVHFEKPPPLVPRHRCFGVPERLGASGEVVRPLDEAALRQTAARLRDEGVESIAVCFLHSYVNPAHERRAGEILRERFGDEAVSLSCEVAPDFREYFRASTTVINAGIRPTVSRYLERIETRLREAGLQAPLMLMQSSGGVYSFRAAAEKPVFMVESGPAAGVIAAGALGERLGRRDLISFDMGGTTAKAGLVQDGAPGITKEYEVGSAAVSSEHGAKGGGYPIRSSVIDLVEIGAGGGSIAWIDRGGALRVGPRSAGADPGPACYGAGGREPTITDANLVLGRLDPAYFLGGEIRLDVEAAERAVRDRCAEPLGLETVEAARGIVEIANAAMAGALRRISIQRGYDPRDFTLVAFGGAGPVHGNRLARELEIPELLVPPSPGTFSAMGLLSTDLRHDFNATHLEPLAAASESLAPALESLESQGRRALAADGVDPARMRFVRQLDLRYVGQSYELGVEVEDAGFPAAEVRRLADRFHEEHERAYGFKAPEEPVEIVTIRLSAVGEISRPELRRLEADTGAGPAGSRLVYFEESGGFVDCPVYERSGLGAGARIEGPAVVQELDSTTLLHPGYRAEVDPHGNLLIRPEEE